MLSFIKQTEEPSSTNILENIYFQKKPLLSFFLEILKDENLSLDSKQQKYFEKIFLLLIKYSDIGYYFNEYSFDQFCILEEIDIENIRKLVKSQKFEEVYDSLLNNYDSITLDDNISDTIDKLKEGESFSVVFEKFITLRRVNSVFRELNSKKTKNNTGINIVSIDNKSYINFNDVHYEIIKIYGNISIIRSLLNNTISFINIEEKKLLFEGKNFKSIDFENYNQDMYGMFVVGDGKNDVLVDIRNNKIIGENVFKSLDGIIEFKFLLDKSFLTFNNDYLIPINVLSSTNSYYFYKYNLDGGKILKSNYIGDDYIDPIEDYKGIFYICEYINGEYRGKNLNTGDYIKSNISLKNVDSKKRLDLVGGIMIYAENMNNQKGLFNLKTGEFEVYNEIEINVDDNTFTYKPDGLLSKRLEL